jgi:hypothetical protein
MFSNAITAVALTEYLARYLDQVIDDHNTPPPDISIEQLKQLFASAITKKQQEKTNGAAAGAAVGEDAP